MFTNGGWGQVGGKHVYIPGNKNPFLRGKVEFSLSQFNVFTQKALFGSCFERAGSKEVEHRMDDRPNKLVVVTHFPRPVPQR